MSAIKVKEELEKVFIPDLANIIWLYVYFKCNFCHQPVSEVYMQDKYICQWCYGYRLKRVYLMSLIRADLFMLRLKKLHPRDPIRLCPIFGFGDNGDVNNARYIHYLLQ